MRLQKLKLGSQKPRRLHSDFISFFVIPQGFWGQNPKYKGGNVKGVDRLHCFWMYKALWIGIDHWTLVV
jgi:hypothetical protein